MSLIYASEMLAVSAVEQPWEEKIMHIKNCGRGSPISIFLLLTP